MSDAVKAATENQPWWKNFFVGTVVVGVLVFVLGISWYALWRLQNGDAEHIVRWSQFGDAFGMVNTIFSGLSLAAVALTLWMQSVELRHQREELSSNTKSQQDQHRAMVDASWITLVTELMQMVNRRLQERVFRPETRPLDTSGRPTEPEALAARQVLEYELVKAFAKKGVPDSSAVIRGLGINPDSPNLIPKKD